MGDKQRREYQRALVSLTRWTREQLAIERNPKLRDLLLKLEAYLRHSIRHLRTAKTAEDLEATRKRIKRADELAILYMQAAGL